MRNNFIDEVLELFRNLKEGDRLHPEIALTELKGVGGEKVLAEMAKQGLVEYDDQFLKLTAQGEKEASGVIRRHRLAERLLVDILGMKLEEIDMPSCRFEHVLADGVDEAVCTLLGHPQVCPHGKPIPPGNCCHRSVDQVKSLFFDLTELEVGGAATIAYLACGSHPRVHKLVSLGIYPGVKIELHQKFPSYIVRIEQTQVALDEQVAHDIILRRNNQE